MRWIWMAGLAGWLMVPVQATEPLVQIETRAGELGIRLGEVEVARYVFRDPQVPRPYFVDVMTPSGIPITRRHPPQKDRDATDHVGLHTGIWLSFGDLSGCDYWRLKARTEHVRFVEEPRGTAGRGSFTVVNRYLATDGRSTVAEETCRYVVRTVPGGYLLELASEFRPGEAELVFGDQEEMGLGVRVATALNVDRKLGGRILDSAGRRNGAEVWGKTADWCDYAGPLQGPNGVRWVGLAVLSGPENLRPSWCHARDYGLLVLNPFGRKAFTQQEASRVVVRPGETLTLRYGVVVHETATEMEYDLAPIYREFSNMGKTPTAHGN